MPLSEDQIKTLVRSAADEAAKEAVSEVFRVMRVDKGDIDSLNALTDDFRYLRRQREAADSIGMKAVLSILAAASTGALAILWLGFQDFFHLK